MEDLNEIKEIVVTVKDEIIDKMETLRGFLENPVDFIKYASLAKEIKNLIKEKAPFLYPEWKFWDNIDKFFNSGILSDDDKRRLIGKLSNEKEKKEVGRKIIDLIGKIDTDKKLVYIINATKAWINDAIDRSQYFRICHVISASLDEDLQFLSEHIDDTGDIPYSIEINGLQTTGLACHTNMDKEGNPLYVFTPLSRAVNEYAIKGAEANAIENFNINEPPFKGTSDEEVQKMIDGIFGKN
ncbi:MAG: hypothetical protein II902_05350 [Selenomonadaceae bacterium]|nr:hypothetical protein [Selenomonadaceae bacterium]